HRPVRTGEETVAGSDDTRHLIVDFDYRPGRATDVGHECRAVAERQFGVALSLSRRMRHTDAGMLRGDRAFTHPHLARTTHFEADATGSEITLEEVGDAALEGECQCRGPVVTGIDPGRRKCAIFNRHAVKPVDGEPGFTGSRFSAVQDKPDLTHL